MAHAAHDFDDLIPWMKRSGFAATGLAALITSSFGWTLGETLIAQVSLAGLLSLCTFIVGYSLVAAYHAWRRQMPIVTMAAVGLFAIGVAVEFMSHTGFTASHRDATIQQAAMQSTLYEDKRAAVAELEADVKRIQQRVAMAPVRTPEAAQAAIDNAMAHRFWDLTDGCKKTRGPQTRAFCDAYASAIADVSMGKERITLLEELKLKQSDLANARKIAASAKEGHASSASQGIILASMLTQSEKPDGSAVFWAGIGISSLLALFAIAAGGLLNFIAFAFDAPRKESAAHHAAQGFKINGAPASYRIVARDMIGAAA